MILIFMILKQIVFHRMIVLLTSILAGVILVYVFLFGGQLAPQQSWVYSSQSPDQAVSAETKADNNSYTILAWYMPWEFTMNLQGIFCEENFGISNCMVVDNRSQFSDADVVIFHNFELMHGYQTLPVHLKHPDKQRWVWHTMESPENNENVKALAGHFNRTMTYHRDADIYSPYGLLVPRDSVSKEPVENFIPKRKANLACWLVSNFKPHHTRTALYEKLKKVIPIEVYGGGATKKRLDCMIMLPILYHCYSYLAFENSIFRDYITEKLWNNAYMSGAVPVVLGPSCEDYEAVAPKGSFIHVNDFNSIEKLREFLKKLSKDKARYASYFDWRHQYTSCEGKAMD